MASKFPAFDRSRLLIRPLAERTNDLQLDHWLALEDAPLPYDHPHLDDVAGCVVRAKKAAGARILMMGAHVLRAGVNRQIIDLLERGILNHIALNGAGAIHDYELARVGVTPLVGHALIKACLGLVLRIGKDVGEHTSFAARLSTRILQGMVDLDRRGEVEFSIPTSQADLRSAAFQ